MTASRLSDSCRHIYELTGLLVIRSCKGCPGENSIETKTLATNLCLRAIYNQPELRHEKARGFLESNYTQEEISRMFDKLKRSRGKRCCGGVKWKAMFQGYTRLLWDKISGNDPGEIVTSRINTCLKCEERTYLNIFDGFLGFFLKRSVKCHTNSCCKLMWCSKCMCLVSAKARSSLTKCPLKKWNF